MSKQFETNASRAYKEFADFTVDEMHKTLKRAVNKALKTIQKQAQTNLQTNYKNTNIVNPKYNDTLVSGIRISKSKVDSNGVITQVLRSHGNGKTGSGTYRLAFLETGTRDRYVRTRNGKPLTKPAFRGKIVPKKFFKPAVVSGVAQWNSIITTEVDKAVKKINAKQ